MDENIIAFIAIFLFISVILFLLCTACALLGICSGIASQAESISKLAESISRIVDVIEEKANEDDY